jgi:hypothetical protein
VGLLQCRLFSLRHAFEGALRDSNLPSPAALLRLPQLLSLHTVQLGNPFAFLSLAQPRLLRGRELPLFQRFEITVLDDALGFAAIDDGFGFPRIVRLAFDKRHGPADQAFAVCAKRSQRLLLALIDALDLVGVSVDGRVLVFSEAVHLAVVQRTHVVRLPARTSNHAMQAAVILAIHFATRHSTRNSMPQTIHTARLTESPNPTPSPIKARSNADA